MDWATKCFQSNDTEGHRVFFTHALVESLDFYAPFVGENEIEIWRMRLTCEVSPDESGDNNWSTYFMLGEWLRTKAGLIHRDKAINAIEAKWACWQRSRIQGTAGNLYHDGTSDPDTLAVEAVGRGNLLALTYSGYDGPSAAEIRDAAWSGTILSIKLLEPSGQAPCNGRTDNHVWVDVGYQLAFEIAAEMANGRGEQELAGQFRRAASLCFQSIERWRRTDGDWAGSYFVTKNRLNPVDRTGYQFASQYTNYNGSLMHHLAQAYEIRQSDIAERPTLSETGGYAFELDDRFSTAFANAGGMHMQADLRGDTELASSADYWCALGVVRFGKAGWDSRLGPSDGMRGRDGIGVSFGPTFRENGIWHRLASIPDQYFGKFGVEFEHQSLVRCHIEYSPIAGEFGPSFRNEFILTPDGNLCSLTRTSGDQEWGVTLPLLVYDGSALDFEIEKSPGIAATRFRNGTDEQTFIVLNNDAIFIPEAPIRSSYGDLLPIRVTSRDDVLYIFVYPRSGSDPAAEEMRQSFKIYNGGFSSVLGRVDGHQYVGHKSATG